MTPDLYSRFISEPLRARGAAVPVAPVLSDEERAAAEHARTVYQLQVACPALSWREARRMVNWSEFTRFLRDGRLLTDRHLAADTFGWLGGLVVVGSWLWWPR